MAACSSAIFFDDPEPVPSILPSIKTFTVKDLLWSGPEDWSNAYSIEVVGEECWMSSCSLPFRLRWGSSSLISWAILEKR